MVVYISKTNGISFAANSSKIFLYLGPPQYLLNTALLSHFSHKIVIVKPVTLIKNENNYFVMQSFPNLAQQGYLTHLVQSFAQLRPSLSTFYTSIRLLVCSRPVQMLLFEPKGQINYLSSVLPQFKGKINFLGSS